MRLLSRDSVARERSLPGFYLLGFLVWGGRVDPKKISGDTQRRQKNFRPSRGVRGHAPQKILKR